jgi:hypothetical protein
MSLERVGQVMGARDPLDATLGRGGELVEGVAGPSWPAPRLEDRGPDEAGTGPGTDRWSLADDILAKL